MQISKLYSNKPDIFSDIIFHPNSLNVVFAEIRDISNLEKDTHNLGKTTLSELIDFLLLKGKSSDFFLFKHLDRFIDFEFFGEFTISENSHYFTVKRCVSSSTKISIKVHNNSNQDFRKANDDIWDYHSLPIAKAKKIIDSILNIYVIKPWGYRSGISYFLRSQNDYHDVFQLSKFKGKHQEWKPYLYHILGFDGNDMIRKYEIENDIQEIDLHIKDIESEYPGEIEPIDKINGKIILIENDIRNLENTIDKFNFIEMDDSINEDLVKNTETSIASLNEQKYMLSMEIEHIRKQMTLDYKSEFKQITEIFEDAKIYFGDQIKKDYQNLIEFNKKITTERKSYLQERLTSIEIQLTEIMNDLKDKNELRQNALQVLKEKNTFKKFRSYQDKIIEQKTNLHLLGVKKTVHERIASLKKQKKEFELETNNLTEKVYESINESNKIYDSIRLKFSELIREIIDEDAVISITQNNAGNLEFEAEITKTGLVSSQSKGTSYKRLLCAAFDLAVLITYSGQPFFHFVYHDGILEGLDARKKIKIIDLVRRTCSKYNIQHIITVIDSDWPLGQDGNRYKFNDSEIVKKLHDTDQTGRLFQFDEF